MTIENEIVEKKSIRYALGKHKDADGLACDCVGLANARGGTISIGIEDDQVAPPLTQRMSDGRYFLRVSDETCRLLPDDLGRLMADRGSFVWELQVSAVLQSQVDTKKVEAFYRRIRASERVSDFVKKKSDAELLEHYFFVRNGRLTNLGILWVGRREDRAALCHAPAIQVIKFDERAQKVRKLVWNDYSLNPLELIEAVWADVPDWRESYEYPDGLFRKTVPHYDEAVVRELLANALVHRPYTQRGDIFLNLHADRLEVHNPGLLPIGVTPRNILHTTRQRNPHLAKVFYELKLMEGEGSGFDRMYELLLKSGRPVPEVREEDDRVVVTIWKRIVQPAILDFMFKADEAFQLTQKELIVLGLLAQNESLTAVELARKLDVSQMTGLGSWLGRLRSLGVVGTSGRTKATRYFVTPEILKRLDFPARTSLRRIETHRLDALIIEDLGRYPKSSIGEIHKRIGSEVPRSQLKRALERLVARSAIIPEGEKRWRRYVLAGKPIEQ